MRTLTKIAAFCSAALLYSCTTFYVPTAQNAPLFSKQGEVVASGTVGISGANVQAAAAVTDHVAVIVDGMYADNSNENREEFRKHKALEFGVGYFHKRNFHFDAFAGMGWGKGESIHQTLGILTDAYEKEFSGAYKKYFLQTSFGMSRKHVEGALSTRLTAIRYSTLHYAEDGEPIWVTKKPRVFFEPVFTFRVFPGGRKFFFVGQAGLSMFMNRKNENEQDDDYHYRYESLHFSVGAGFKFGRKAE